MTSLTEWNPGLHRQSKIIQNGGKLSDLLALMSQKQVVILSTPARKVFAGQLHSDSSLSVSINQVWVQGIVVLVSADGNDLFLDDGTGIIQANGVTKIVKDLFIQKGMYVMVAGKLLLSASGKRPSIRVLKIADLSNNPHSEALWFMEVVHAQLKGKDR